VTFTIKPAYCLAAVVIALTCALAYASHTAQIKALQAQVDLLKAGEAPLRLQPVPPSGATNATAPIAPPRPALPNRALPSASRWDPAAVKNENLPPEMQIRTGKERKNRPVFSKEEKESNRILLDDFDPYLNNVSSPEQQVPYVCLRERLQSFKKKGYHSE